VRAKATDANAYPAVVAEARAAAEETGILPLDYILSVMRDANADNKRRDAMATAAAPYLHSKLATVEPPELPDKSDIPSVIVTFVRPTHVDEDDN